MLEGPLSGDAVRAYCDLLTAGSVTVTGTGPPGAIGELIDKGFARELHDDEREPRVVAPIAPATAVENAIFNAQQRLVAQHSAILRARQDIHVLQLAYTRRVPRATTDLPTRLVTDLTERKALAAEVLSAARSEVLWMQTAQACPVSALASPQNKSHARGVRQRRILDQSALTTPDLDGQEPPVDEDVRIIDSLPSGLVVVDGETALVPMGPQDGVLVLQFPVVVRLLALFFERTWSRAIPITTLRSRPQSPLTRAQQRVLELCLTGITDAAIARQLRVSERTVRRHVSDLLTIVGAANRVSAAAIAVREGWVT